ncbi:MAG: endolytic transglycosylase MltG [Candidatus Buchananbacteria bacterium]
MFFGKKKKKKRYYALGFILVILASWFFYLYILDTAISRDAQLKEFIVEPGWGSTKISQELEKQGLISNSWVFELYVWFKGVSSKLQDGQYFLAKNLSIKEIAQILSRGAGVTKEVNLTFIEGWNNEEYADYLTQKGISSKTDFLAVIQKKADWWDESDFLASKPRNLDLEGYLFPDTYRIYHDAAIKDIVRKMLDNFGKKLTPELRAEITRQGKTIHEIVTLASILEKEVSSETDRKLVADIFYKRLKAGMPLQADSTVNYVTGKGVSRSTAVDTKIDNPYNTYKYKGLPPGPICNPGLSAITAAIYPQANPYWYFLTTPDGQVIYSKTHDEHVKAKAKYYQ